MKKTTLSNGLKIIHHQRRGDAVVIEIMVKVGSNDEKKEERGISHFIEHMLFEGTTKRPTNGLISNEIEKIGGDFNAYTTNERTCYHVKVLKKHFNVAIDVLADIFKNSLFAEEQLSKEKNIVLKEIDMVYDDPRFYQWILLQENLFKKHPTKNPTYGNKNVIRQLTRRKVLTYFQKYYVPNNIVISLVGEIPQWKKIIKEHFLIKKKELPRKITIKEPLDRKITFKKERRKIANTYLTIGFKTCSRNNPDSYVIEVINGILGRGQSGKMFTEIRGKRGLAYDVGTQHVSERGFGYFAVYATIDKNNLKFVRNLIGEELKKLRKTSEKDLEEAKQFVEGYYLLEMEDPQKIADQILFWENIKEAHLMSSFVKKIKEVTLQDIKRVTEKYFKNPTIAIIQGK